MIKLSTFKMEALIEDTNLFTEPTWLEVFDFKFHTTGEYPMVTVEMPEGLLDVGFCAQTYTVLSVKGFRVKE